MSVYKNEEYVHDFILKTYEFTAIRHSIPNLYFKICLIYIYTDGR